MNHPPPSDSISPTPPPDVGNPVISPTTTQASTNTASPQSLLATFRHLQQVFESNASPTPISAFDHSALNPYTDHFDQFLAQRKIENDAMEQKFQRQILYGCTDPICRNPYCASNPAHLPRDLQEAEALACMLSKLGEAYACFELSDDDVSPHTPVKKKSKDHGIYINISEPVEDNDTAQLKGLELDLFQMLLERANAGNAFMLEKIIDHVFSSYAKLSNSFRTTGNGTCPNSVDNIRIFYQSLQQFNDGLLRELLGKLTLLFNYIRNGLEIVREDNLGIFLFVFEHPYIWDPICYNDLLFPALQLMANLPQVYQMLLVDYFASPRPFLKESYSRYVNIIHQFITLRLVTLMTSPNKDMQVVDATKAMSILYKANQKYNVIPFTDFYNESLNEQLEIKDDFPQWKTKEGFTFCDYAFILNSTTKSDILRVESMVQMRHELQDAFFRAMFEGVNSPYLYLEVRREHIIRDTLFQLESRSDHDLKKQLKVQFIGEEGVDEGGVQKEFFQLIVREMFDAKYGMFSFNEESRLYWFASTVGDTMDNLVLEEVRLIGKLLGLAIYNSVILDLRFPSALYKKLQGEPVGFHELSGLDPMLYKSLMQVVEFEGDVAETFDRNFTIDVEVLGSKHEVELLPGGRETKLTNENRNEFVNAYADYVLNRSIEKQFILLKEGFELVCQGSAIQIFRSEELEQLICGSSDLDFDALQGVTQYDGGYEPETPVILYFWQVVKGFTEEQKKRILFFTTGSDRVPIGGLAKLQFTIAKNGTDSDRLPTSHTCFNVLLLPDYASKERLESRLLTAIQNAEGFGMI